MGRLSVLTPMVVITLSIAMLFLLVPPIPQDPTYHDFADKRSLLGIPNFADVMSNVPFMLGGFYGVYTLMWTPASSIGPAGYQWWVFFMSGSCVSVGSAYYHWNPTTSTLFWDRLPMTVSFMSIVDVLIVERINQNLGKRLFVPLLAVGVSSVMWWALTEWWTGVDGDLRFYVLVQAAPVIGTPLVLAFFPAMFTHSVYISATIACYVAAKFAEAYDHAIYHATFGLISGHTVKHLIASTGMFWLSRMLSERKMINK